jgi:hypothetical protein
MGALAAYVPIVHTEAGGVRSFFQPTTAQYERAQRGWKGKRGTPTRIGSL